MSAALQTGADARAMRATKFPPEFNKKVDMSKINLPVIKKWVTDEITRILNNEDDVVTEMIFSILEGSKPNMKQLQTDLTGFLDKDAPPFCLELWNLCLSAQDDPNGIPKELLEAKKVELLQERIAEDKAREEAMKRQADERERDLELQRIRDRERGQRGRGGRGGGGRDRERDRGYGNDSRRPPSSRDSRSPPRRRNGPRETDSYKPSDRGPRNDRPPFRRRRSPSYGRSPSRSRSPPRQRRRVESSSDYSRSPSPPPRRGGRDDYRNGRNTRRSDRSPYPTRRGSSPSSRDRSPPRRRRRSPSRSRSRSPRRYRDESSDSRPPRRDLMSRDDRNRDTRRLSRGGSSLSGSMAGGNDQDDEQVGND